MLTEIMLSWFPCESIISRNSRLALNAYFWPFLVNLPAGNYMLKVNNRNTKTRCEISSRLTIKIPERRQWCRFVMFIVNFEHISHLVLVFLLLTLSR